MTVKLTATRLGVLRAIEAGGVDRVNVDTVRGATRQYVTRVNRVDRSAAVEWLVREGLVRLDRARAVRFTIPWIITDAGRELLAEYPS